jgi:hypothetical protein
MKSPTQGLNGPVEAMIEPKPCPFPPPWSVGLTSATMAPLWGSGRVAYRPRSLAVLTMSRTDEARRIAVTSFVEPLRRPARQ